MAFGQIIDFYSVVLFRIANLHESCKSARSISDLNAKVAKEASDLFVSHAGIAVEIKLHRPWPVARIDRWFSFLI